MTKQKRKGGYLTSEEIATRDYKSLRSLVFVCLFFVNPVFGFGASFPLWQQALPRFTVLFFWLFLGVYLIQIITAIILLRDGWSHWFMMFLSSFAAGLGVCFASGFFLTSGTNTIDGVTTALLTWLLLSPFLWWWGSRVYLSKGEIKEAVILSKRIDLEQATYSPYLMPHDLYKAKWARATLVANTALVGAAAGVGAFVSHLGGTGVEDPSHFGGAVVAYMLVVLTIFCISVGYHEARWMRRWEQKTGRKIYVKEIIRWKQLQAQKQAQQNLNERFRSDPKKAHRA